MNQAVILSVCMVSYNTADLTVKALDSLIDDIHNSSYKHKSEIIVVDNHSNDESVAKIHQLSKQRGFAIRVIDSKQNLGFSKANNLAISQSKGAYIWLLNSDTYVQPGTTQKLIDTFYSRPDRSTEALSSSTSQIDRLGMVAASLVYPDGRYQFQGGSLPSLLTLATHMLLLDDLPFIGRLLPSTQETDPHSWYHSVDPRLLQVGWVAGTAVVIRKALLDEVGLLDEKIFMYAEDMELCVRAKHHHWDICIHPDAYVTHLKTASSNQSKAIVGEFQGYLYIWSKHKPLWQYQWAKLLLKTGCMIRMLVFGTMRQTEKVSTYQAVLAELR